MPRVLPVSLATSCDGCSPYVLPNHHFWIGEGSDGSMLTRLKNWVRGSDPEEGSARLVGIDYMLLLLAQVAVVRLPPLPETDFYPTKIFDEQCRGKPQR
jgi:hypothetical protein